MIYSIFALIMSIIYLLLDRSKYKLFAIGSSSLLIFFGLSFDLIDHPLMQVFFKYIKPHISYISFLYFYIASLSLLIGNFLVFLFYNRNVYELEHRKYSSVKLKRIFYFLTVLSFFGVSLNMLNVFRSGLNLGTLFINPRYYEEVFGYNVIINYLYFLNIPAILVYIYIRKIHNDSVRFGKLFVFILIMISFLHAIKYTIFDTILIPGIFYLIVNKKTKIKYIALGFSSLIAVYFSFSLLVRGGYFDNQLLNIGAYILPNYYNLMYNIETYQSQWAPPYNLIIPDKLQFLMPKEFIVNPGVGSSYSINPSYNMYTSLDILYTDFNLLGPLFLILIFAIAIFLYNKKNNSIFYCYILTFLLYNFNMGFYVYGYIKIKYFYYIVLFLFIHLVSKKESKEIYS